MLRSQAAGARGTRVALLGCGLASRPGVSGGLDPVAARCQSPPLVQRPSLVGQSPFPGDSLLALVPVSTTAPLSQKCSQDPCWLWFPWGTQSSPGESLAFLGVCGPMQAGQAPALCFLMGCICRTPSSTPTHIRPLPAQGPGLSLPRGGHLSAVACPVPL